MLIPNRETIAVMNLKKEFFISGASSPSGGVEDVI
jgi:hypothetical protein